MELKRLQFRVASGDVTVVAGPTGAGKTAFALKLAAENPLFELVNADSVQIFKGLEIGSNKGKLLQPVKVDLPAIVLRLGAQQFQHKPLAFAQQPETVIWLTDLLFPNQEFSVTDYQKWARTVIANILERGKQPLLVGGSGLYVNAALFDYNFSARSAEPKFQLPDSVAELYKLLESNKIGYSHLNPSDIKNPRRLQNLYLREGAPQLETQQLKSIYNLDVYLLEPKLADLKLQLQTRAREMLAAGLVAEAEALIFTYGDTLAQQLKVASGYRQVFAKAENLAEAIAKSHIKLARKQLTWNKKYLASASKRTD